MHYFIMYATTYIPEMRLPFSDKAARISWHIVFLVHPDVQ